MVVTESEYAARFAARLDEALTHGGYPKGRQRIRDVAVAFDVSRESVRKWLAGESFPKTERIIGIAERLGVRSEWLLSGTGEMLEIELPGIGKPARHTHRLHASVSTGPNLRGEVPLISWVQAGAWHEASDLYELGDAEDWLPCPRRHGPRTYALRVMGQSMWNPGGRPSYDEGDIIFVDPDQAGGVASGDRVIALLTSASERVVTFKQLVSEGGQHFLRPLNPQYPPITDRFDVVGKVIGAWRD